MGHDFRDLVGHVGSGPKSADDMDYEQAKFAFGEILSGDVSPVALGGFWVANRWKRNTPEELAGFVDAMVEETVSVAPDCDPVDCGANYDGKSRTALLGVASGLVAAAAGTPVVVHSGDRVPMSDGCAYRHVLSELGVDIDLDPETSAEMSDEVGFGFYDQARFNPAVAALEDDRRALGVRTFVNTVETLANPAEASVHLGSFFHTTFGERVINTLSESRTQEIDRVLMFQGLEGYDDVRPGHTTYVEWDGAEIETDRHEMAFDGDALDVDDVPGDSARITEEVLSGEADDDLADAVAFNAALRLYARGDVQSIDDGVERACDVLADGSAEDRLVALRQFDA
ncbi:anthranilate phosphoribosyltransferase [Haladaptatus sp. DYF46]|uniref:anthranilate phosphoribosyltransferase n=1 Tax=Haladaptatus sp. DYF46 TaxID=2886041 RepID=UPI001E2E477B|nr:anthranilate phosphoribosyltransferase [Haladaptatus sp. DYF46]